MSRSSFTCPHLTRSLQGMVFITMVWSSASVAGPEHPSNGFFSVQDAGPPQLVHALEVLGQARQVLISNLSNSKTTAYKRYLVRFGDEHSLRLSRDMSQGALVHTGRSLDLAVSGKGWFQISLPTGETAYTRAGTFMIGADGLIANEQGYPLEPAVFIPTDCVSTQVGSDGMISCTGPDGTASTIGAVQLAVFPRGTLLGTEDNGLFSATEASGHAVLSEPGNNGAGTLKSGYLETSNVKVLEDQYALKDLVRLQDQLHHALDLLHHKTSQTHPQPPLSCPVQNLPIKALHDRLEYQTRLENQLKAKAQELLFALVGQDRCRISITARLDMDMVYTVEEVPGEGKVARQCEDVTNEKPAGTSHGAKTQSHLQTEYTMGKVVETIHHLPGEVNRLSVAVLIDLSGQDHKNNTPSMSIENVHELIRAALGLQEDDTLIVKEALLR